MVEVFDTPEKVATFSAAVALIGSPNVGKSTLLNRILGKKVSIVSDKPQTTEHRILGVFTRANRQIIFYDTPGIGKPIGERAARINRIAEETACETDLIVWMLDARKGIGENDRKILKSIERLEKPVIAVFNKMDLSTNEQIIPWVSELVREHKINEFVPISAKSGDNVERLLSLILSLAPENPLLYGPEEITDQDDSFVIAEFIREQVFINSEKEVPYSVRIELETLKDEPDGSLSVAAVVYVDNPRHRRILIGEKGAMVRNIRLFSQKRLKEYFSRKISLTLLVKARKPERKPRQ